VRYDDAVYTDHAREKMARRELTTDQVMGVLQAPDAEFPVRPGRRVLQRRIRWGNPPQDYLLRVFVDVDRIPPEIVTVYLASKIAKYEANP